MPTKINQESVDNIKTYVKKRIGEIMTEATNEFDVKKMLKLVKQSKYLTRAFKMIKGGN